MAEAQHILVVDDDPEISRLLKGYLSKAGYQVSVAASGSAALQQLRTSLPDLLILDLMLPDVDGWEITGIVRADQEMARVPIIMLTARVDDHDKIEGLEVGADDYMTKPFNPREVVARTRALLRRTQMHEEVIDSVVTVGAWQMNVRKREMGVGNRPVDLTRTEFNVLRILMEFPGYAFTRSELIERALGFEYVGMDRTLDTHIKNLRRKLEEDGTTSPMIETIYGVGYRLSE